MCIRDSLAAVAGLGDVTGLPVHFSLIPSAAWVYREDLPANAPNWDQQLLLDAASDIEDVYKRQA